MNKDDLCFLKKNLDNEVLNQYNSMFECGKIKKIDLFLLQNAFYNYFDLITFKYNKDLVNYYIFLLSYSYYYLFTQNNDSLKNKIILYKNSLKLLKKCSNDIKKYIIKFCNVIDLNNTSDLYLLFSLIERLDEMNHDYFNYIINQFECNVKRIDFISNKDIDINHNIEIEKCLQKVINNLNKNMNNQY